MKLKNPYVQVSVNVHNEEEVEEFYKLVEGTKFAGSVDDSNFEQPAGDWICENCGWEVRDHDENQNCRDYPEE